MDKRKNIALLSVFSVSILTLAGCATANHTTISSNVTTTNQTAQASTTSKSSVGGNSSVITSSNPTANATNTTTPSTVSPSKIQETSYNNASAAAKAISKLQRNNTYLAFTSTKFPTVNLDLGITAKQDGGLDHRGLQWHEGNWIVETLWFSGNQGAIQMAKNIVSYLHTHMLPAPHHHGVIIVNSTDPNSKTFKASTTIAWQEGNKVYRLKQSGNPIRALTTVVNSNNAPTSSSEKTAPVTLENIQYENNAVTFIMTHGNMASTYADPHFITGATPQFVVTLRNSKAGKYPLNKVQSVNADWAKDLVITKSGDNLIMTFDLRKSLDSFKTGIAGGFEIQFRFK